jgi:tyrosyl-tRNA synthetase
MSKSLDNYVGLTEPPDEMFGKLMTNPDGLISRYELLCLQIDPERHAEIEAGLADGSIHPNDEKRAMARGIVDRYHGVGAGAQAEAAFDRVHREHRLPEDVPGYPVADLPAQGGTVSVAHALAAAGLASSTSEARRLIGGGGVRLDGEVVMDVELTVPPETLTGRVLQVGRRRFVRFV